jgi:hypothetical protein
MPFLARRFGAWARLVAGMRESQKIGGPRGWKYWILLLWHLFAALAADTKKKSQRTKRKGVHETEWEWCIKRRQPAAREMCERAEAREFLPPRTRVGTPDMRGSIWMGLRGPRGQEKENSNQKCTTVCARKGRNKISRDGWGPCARQ